MSVINTNITSMIGQSNLQKSQSALQTSMERLSSGLRINSAKDDAAGQAIANRMTAQITGLSQAQRNANDGISVAQTAEGALNQVNDNLQRIRELSVQAQNETNSSDDLKSIQDEIGQRLSEIDRISKETSFNGVDVLASDRGLEIQVGANDGEMITVNLKEINAQTLGLSTFNVDAMKESALSDALTEAGTGTSNETVTIGGNAATAPTTPSGPTPSGITAVDVYENSAGNGFAVEASDGNFYTLTENAATGEWVFDSSDGALNPDTDVNVAAGPVTNTVREVAAPTITVVDSGDATAGNDGVIAVTNLGANPSGITFTAGAIYQRNDQVGTGGLAEYAVAGSDGNYYALTATRDAANDEITFTLDENNLEQVSETNVNTTAATSVEMALEGAPVPNTNDLLNEDLTIPGEDGLYALADGSGFAVKGDNGNYYAATLNGGNVSWDSSTGNIDDSLVDGSTEILTIENAPVTGSYTGLEAGETLHSYEDADGATQYVIKSGTGDDATFTKAELGAADATTGDIAVTKQTGEDANLAIRTESPLAALDSALNQVDSLRSELGAVQNRFEDAITNLNTNETNLAAARSRIEDADYAVEVANMTRAQILQQAGTSVLAQANQIPQNVLSLLG